MPTVARSDSRNAMTAPSGGRPFRARVRVPPRGTGANAFGRTVRPVSRGRPTPDTDGGVTVNVRSAPRLVPSGPEATRR